MRSARPAQDRKFGCPKCAKKFFTPKDLRRHENTHLGLREHVCQSCLQRFGRKDHLTRHAKKSCSAIKRSSNSNNNSNNNNNNNSLNNNNNGVLQAKNQHPYHNHHNHNNHHHNNHQNHHNHNHLQPSQQQQQSYCHDRAADSTTQLRLSGLVNSSSTIQSAPYRSETNNNSTNSNSTTTAELQPAPPPPTIASSLVDQQQQQQSRLCAPFSYSGAGLSESSPHLSPDGASAAANQQVYLSYSNHTADIELNQHLPHHHQHHHHHQANHQHQHHQANHQHHHQMHYNHTHAVHPNQQQYTSIVDTCYEQQYITDTFHEQQQQLQLNSYADLHF